MSTDVAKIPNPSEMNPTEIARQIEKAWGAFVNSDSRPGSKRSNVYASSYKECTRQMVLDMTHGDTLPSFDADTLARFRRGNDRERDLMSDLQKIGRNCEPAFDVVGGQERFEIRDRKGRIVITGKIDGRLAFKDYKNLKFLQGRRSASVEAKAWNANLVAKIETFDDLFTSRWTKGGAYQTLSYIFAQDEPVGFMMLDRAGLPALIPVELYPNLERVEKFIAKSEEAMDHKEAGTLPDYVADKEECKFCPHFGRNCNPPMTFGEGAQVFTDPEILANVERLKLLEGKLSDEEWTEYNRLEKWAKDKFRGVLQGIAGAFLIIGKWQKRKETKVPEAEQAEFNEKKIAYDSYVKGFEFENEKGMFKLQVLRVTESPATPPGQGGSPANKGEGQEGQSEPKPKKTRKKKEE